MLKMMNKEIGLQKMKDSGAGLTSVETALFELLKAAEGEQFKKILKKESSIKCHHDAGNQ